MKNIIKIIALDIKKLSTNVVAMVVIIGLTVIPSLYAWFNILSNWDPYGPSATRNLQVAVATSDQGIILGNYELNVGNIIIENLKGNDTIGWVFTDTAEEAISGVHSGEYYAALVIDEEFSANMISFLGGEIENPKITYYENDKKNAIAPKITGKVKTAIEREVDHAFISTLAESLLSASEYFATLDEQGNITGQGIEKLEQLDSDMKGLITLLDSYIALADSTESITEAGKAITSSADSITTLAEKMAENAQSTAEAGKKNIQNAKSDADARVQQMNTDLDDIDSSVKKVNDFVNAYSIDNPVDTEKLREYVDTLVNKWGDLENNKGYYYILYNYPMLNKEKKAELQQKANDINEKIILLDKNTDVLIKTSTEGKDKAQKAKDDIVKDVAGVLVETSDVRTNYLNQISPLEQRAIDTTSDSVTEIKKLLNYNATSIDMVVENLGNYKELMSNSKDSLIKSRNEAVEMESQLAKLIADIKSLNDNEAYQKFMELVKSDPELLSDFISSPVAISDEYIYPVENNGSMTAPFYIILSIWVGALIMSTILKTTVKDTTGMENLKNWECFFGRYFTTFVIGQIQTLITVLGAFLFVGIQCEHKFLFWLACAWTACVYSLLLYSFAYSFGNLGEALSVILMVIQVAGAGGTFPIEVLPKVFQVLYRFMPFNYSMNALRECIGGFYEDTYRRCMLTLIFYAIIAVFNGVVLYHPFKFLNEKIESSKENSGILL